MKIKLLAALLFLVACKEDPGLRTLPPEFKNDRAEITSIDVAGNVVIPDGQVSYVVLDPASTLDLSSLLVSCKHSENSTLSIENNSKVDFSKGTVDIVVTSESKSVTKKYSVHVSKASQNIVYIQNNKFMMNGKPYCGIGVNYFELFCRNYYEAGNKTTLQGLKDLANVGIPFVRFAGPYSQGDWKSWYQDNKSSYYAWMDEIVRCAEENKIKLIPSFFWNVASIKDLTGEKWDALKNDYSNSVGFIKSYVREFVTRYKDSEAILGWEFGNEFSLMVDYSKDAPSNDCMVNAFEEFGKAIREIDKVRPIFTGNTEPRFAAYSLAYSPNKEWLRGSEYQYGYMVKKFECSPINTFTIRGYYDETLNNAPLGIPTFSEFLKVMQKFSNEVGKPIFIGEFGARLQKSHITESMLRPMFEDRLNAIVDNKIQLSAIWVFDRPGSEDDKTNTTFTNDRSYILEALIKANNQMKNQ